MFNPTLPILVTLARCSRFQAARDLLDHLEDVEGHRLGELLLAGVVEAETHDLTAKLAAIRALAGVESPPQPADPQVTLFDYLLSDWS